MRRDHHRERGLQPGDAVERGEERLAARQVEPAARLVEQEQARLREERTGDQRPLALSLGAVAEPPLSDRSEPERPDELVGPVEVEAGEALLEVADRRGCSRADDLPHGQQRGKAAADARVHEPDRLAQPREVGPAHRLSQDLDGAGGGEVHCAGDRQQRRLPGAVRPEERPALSGAHRPGDPVDDRLPRAARDVPAPYADVLEAERGVLTGLASAV